MTAPKWTIRALAAVGMAAMIVAAPRADAQPKTDPKAPRFILTVPGEGYKFAARPQRAEPAAPPARAEREPRESSMANVERRQITVLACQISSYGALAAKHDPQDVHAAMTNVYQVEHVHFALIFYYLIFHFVFVFCC